MKLFRNIAFSALLTIGAFSAVTYTSCSSSSKDKCAGVVCQNGGTCTSSTGDCACPTGTSGTLCDTLDRTKLIKTWTASDPTSSTTLVYSATIVAGTDISQILIGKIADSFFTGNVTATVSGNNITITTQSPDADNYTIQGTGIYANGKITWNYSITNTSTSSVVTVTNGLWQ